MSILSKKLLGFKKEGKLKEIILSWQEKSILLTSKRDQIRNEIADIKEQIGELKTKLAEFIKDIESRWKIWRQWGCPKGFS